MFLLLIFLCLLGHAQYILWATDPDRGFFLVSEEKKNENKNENLLAGCRREIRVILERFRRFFNRKPTDFVKKSLYFLECRGKK